MSRVMNLQLLIPLLLLLQFRSSSAQLSTDFYSQTCHNAQQIVRDAMRAKFSAQRVAAAGLLRIFFHDAFVEGLDASVLITSTPSNKAEKDFADNLSLPGDGFDAVFKAKAALDRSCPGVVSCADALVMATKEMLVLMGGPSWDVRLGRKDGLLSKDSRVAGNLPNPNMTVDQLTSLFQSKGFSRREMIVLSGGHSAGFAHCDKFMDRLYDSKLRPKTDPSMDSSYADGLRRNVCPAVGLDPTVVANLDDTTPFQFDNVYFKNLGSHRGLLRSDQILWQDSRTQGDVMDLAGNQAKFFREFAAAMDKLSALNVKTGKRGEIRKNCGAFN